MLYFTIHLLNLLFKTTAKIFSASLEEVKSYTCTPPFEAVGGGCYYYSSDVGITVDSYAVAETLCTAEGGHLGYIKTGEENTAIVEYFFGNSSEHHLHFTN